MQVKIKRIDKSLPLPEYQTKGSVAFDVYSRIDMEINSKNIGRIPTNLVIECPQGYMMQIKGRSSMPKKKNLWADVGYIDQDYCGENDEILLQVYNFSDNIVKVSKGERLGQIAFVKIETAQWEEIEKMNDQNRGGFGSTD